MLQGLPGELGCGEVCVVAGLQEHAAAAAPGLRPPHDGAPLQPALNPDFHHAGNSGRYQLIADGQCPKKGSKPVLSAAMWKTEHGFARV